MREWKAGWSAIVLVVAAMLGGACGGGRDAGETGTRGETAAAVDSGPTATMALTLEGLQAPEAARFDPELGLYFVSNINGSPMAKDGNGFISRVTRDGKIDSLKLIEGGRGGVRLNAPKGLAIKGDTLRVADIDNVRVFDKRSGKPIATVSLTGKAKFLNDAAVGPDGAVYFTDTGVDDDGKGGMGAHTGPDLVFRVEGKRASVAVEFKDKPGPNGITWDSAGSRFIVAPLNATAIYQWEPGDSVPTVLAQGPGGMDGIEALGDGRFVVTTWTDSSLFLLQNDNVTRLIGGLPGPADIGLDRERGRVAVPQLTENRLTFVDLRP
jgi:sugar lactone lactonase YvrE